MIFLLYYYDFLLGVTFFKLLFLSFWFQSKSFISFTILVCSFFLQPLFYCLPTPSSPFYFSLFSVNLVASLISLASSVYDFLFVSVYLSFFSLVPSSPHPSIFLLERLETCTPRSISYTLTYITLQENRETAKVNIDRFQCNSFGDPPYMSQDRLDISWYLVSFYFPVCAVSRST